MQYVASISYGKDSLAMLHVIKDILHKPLDRIVTAEVWATDTIQADLPPMVEFKDKADRIIRERWGIEVERFCAVDDNGEKLTFEKMFYKKSVKGKYIGNIYGFPTMAMRGGWCKKLKFYALERMNVSLSHDVSYVGIAADEPKRIERKKDNANISMPLVDAEWTEAMCRNWCEENGLLSPLYAASERGGCWFCNCQSLGQLKRLRKEYPDLWELLMKWDGDSTVKFDAHGFTVHDLDKRFQFEGEGYFNYSKFGWDSLKAAQMNIDQFL